MDKKTAYIALSGGVDSSVAAALLQGAGFELVGVHMKCWSALGDCGIQDANDARRVSEKLDIPFYIWNFEKEYKARVVDYMIDGYQKGITPNPDIMCNKEIKFGLFLEKALRLGADYVATGHYVQRVENKDGTFSLFAGADQNKDQSYFLWTLNQEQLAHSLFPIGELEKPEVRKIAKKYKLPTADKKDSQGICFMGQITMDEFLAEYIPEKRGEVKTTSGKVVGEHKGVNYYTIGQRHGLGIGGGTPYYVAQKDLQSNTLIVSEGSEDELLYKKEIEINNVHFIRPIEIPKKGLAVLARVRYRQPLSRAMLTKISKENYRLLFKEPVKFVALGQSAVFYIEENEMLGGGIIV